MGTKTITLYSHPGDLPPFGGLGSRSTRRHLSIRQFLNWLLCPPRPARTDRECRRNIRCRPPHTERRGPGLSLKLAMISCRLSRPLLYHFMFHLQFAVVFSILVVPHEAFARISFFTHVSSSQRTCGWHKGFVLGGAQGRRNFKRLDELAIPRKKPLVTRSSAEHPVNAVFRFCV